MPSGKRTIPVTLPMGIRLLSPNGSHCHDATSL